jgi:hypothetical protein
MSRRRANVIKTKFDPKADALDCGATPEKDPSAFPILPGSTGTLP